MGINSMLGSWSLGPKACFTHNHVTFFLSWEKPVDKAGAQGCAVFAERNRRIQSLPIESPSSLPLD